MLYLKHNGDDTPQSCEGKSDDSKDSSYEELQQVFDNFLLGEVNAKVGREYFQTDNWE
jgi:hypothetical protein